MKNDKEEEDGIPEPLSKEEQLMLEEENQDLMVELETMVDRAR
jgi:hypothetical protein